jgi:predicted NBD/HSP70 family sugar kinase
MHPATSATERVLSYLLEQQAAVTRPMIAAACEISRPTVFTAIERLVELDLVEDIGQMSGRPGRSATLYQMSPTAGAVAAVDIGGSNTRVAVADVRGKILAERREPTAAGGGPKIVEHATEMVRRALSTASAEPARLTTVAVSVPGVLDPDGGTVHYAINIDQFSPFDFRGPLGTALGAPVAVENNVNLAAMGERWQGVAQDLSTFAVVAVGAGIGAGIVHDGKLLRGSHGAAGEVAFLPPYGGQIRDHTMRKDAAGGLRLLEEAKARSGWRGAPPATVEELFRRAAAGEETAMGLVEDECRSIAAVIAALCAIVDPEKVILTGGVGGNDELIRRADKLIAGMAAFPPPVIRSELGERASLVGAVWLATRVARTSLLASVG